MLKRLLISILAIMTATVMLAACSGTDGKNDSANDAGRQIHVASNGSDETGDGSEDKPYATPAFAVKKIPPGGEVIVHEGTYGQFVIDEETSGTAADPVVIRAAEGERAVIESAPGDESVGIYMVNVDNITLDGFEVRGGTHGIYYDSTPDRGEKALENITIRNCKVHGIRGIHGICVYAGNDLAPVKNLAMSGCEVYDCECYDSESTVLNGNIDGFLINNNIIHDNNNIGIDMIGFEGTAAHEGTGSDNAYDSDYVRNGECCGNVVYNISSDGNEAYFVDGEYQLCADGIYVDGGQDIEIHDNFVFNCDIGIEVATEHSPDDNELFRVSGIEVHDNVVAGCMGWCGMCFGGYDADLGFTEDCSFHNNTFVDNGTIIGVQRSRNNKIYDNIFAGEGEEIEYNEDVAEEDMVNEFDGNVSTPDGEGVLDGFRSLIEGKGSSFVPDEKYVDVYWDVCLQE